MTDTKQMYYYNRGRILVKNLQSRHFDAYYCETKAQALEKALELIPEGSSIGWGGAMSCQQIGLMDALKQGNYRCSDRDTANSAEERENMMKQMLFSDVFLSGANALSLDGQMVNIDGTGNRLAAICYGPGSVIVVAGMNKVEDTLESAINRARTVAAPMNNQRFDNDNPCKTTAACGNCKNLKCICNQILVTRHCRPQGRIKFILVGEDLGM